ncbi:Late embryogenesis abundant (LEA) hydroxyproline-rich glycoprotein family [Trema orientale]|uniref:Late embryogenesis abundant (LEA) hydroxyproline-rich glycoprotein family n=1 Tax=Trema orientale TaxID=63057 RepID=A0A2P5FYH1_TREOI|nr:Late embryogenesis abundant (LEA) hydroxyproline-rich glycoprotein family [Trema orientale]
MEGQVPPASADTDDLSNDEPPPPPSEPLSSPRLSRPETYVIQIPKDQIYRVPPPENAQIAERFRNPKSSKEKKNRYLPCLLCMGITLLVVGLILGLTVLALYYFSLSLEAPEFSIVNVVVRKLKYSSSHGGKSSTYSYKVSLKAENKNSRTGIYYVSRGSSSSLSYGEKNIGIGKFPTLYQGENNSTNLGLVLYGSEGALPRQMAKSMKENKSHSPVWFGLKMNVPVKMYLLFVEIWRKEILVDCIVKVSTLGKGSQVISQACETKFKD